MTTRDCTTIERLWSVLTGCPENAARFASQRTVLRWASQRAAMAGEARCVRKACAVLSFLCLFILSLSAQTQVAPPVIGGNVYGGGNQANVGGSATVQVKSGDINKVFGGARMADVGGNTYVLIDGKNATGYTVINYVYGGNDISGTIGTAKAVGETLPLELMGNEDGVDYTWNTYVHLSSKMICYTAAEAVTHNAALDEALGTTELTADQAAAYNAAMSPATDKAAGDVLTADEAAAYNATLDGAVAGGDVKSPATVSPDNEKTYIGQLFAGGNGDFYYSHVTDGAKTTHSIYYKEGDTTPIATKVTDAGETGFNVPDLAKAYLDIHGGSIVYAYGGGNKATVTEQNAIHLDNPTKVVNSITNPDSITTNNPTGELLTNDRFRYYMGINMGYSHPSSDEFQIGRLFGGNNLAEMKIMPTWNLQSGLVRNLYSGGNKGAMTSPKGLLLDINPDPANTYPLKIDNVYGGCRMADVIPTVDGRYTPTKNSDLSDLPVTYKFPNEMSARVLVRGGDINNVYGGNDITGTVRGGNAIGIYSSIRGDVYGGGNGAYPYTDQEGLKDDDIYGDLWYDKGSSSIESLNAFRPNAEQVSLRLAGTSAAKPTIIGGSVYLGGNSATLKSPNANESGSGSNRLVELKMGSHVIADKVFLGNNGEEMVTNEMLTHFKDNSHSSLSLTDAETFASYMDGVALDFIPSIVFDQEPRDPATYLPYSSYVGSFFWGGNRGSMTYSGTNVMELTQKLIVYDKFVAGCNNANVAAVEGLNAAYEGGIRGTAAERGASGFTEDGKIKDRLILNINGMKIQPKRLYSTEYVALAADTPLTEGETYYTSDAGDGEFVAAANATSDGNVYEMRRTRLSALEWNTAKWKTASNGFIEIGSTGDGDNKFRRLMGGNIYGGCYNSGHVNGNVVINIKDDIVDRYGEHGVFADVKDDDSYTMKPGGERRSGVILDNQGDDVMAVAMTVFGGGHGEDTEIWGSTTINHNNGYAFQIFGGSEEGVIGRKTAVTEGTGESAVTTEKYVYNAAYSTTVNLSGENAGYSEEKEGEAIPETEYIYGGGNEGDVCGDCLVNLGNGRVYDVFGGASNADILGATEVYIGRQPNNSGDYKYGFPWVRDNVYGGNDFGGSVKGKKKHPSVTNRGVDAAILESATYVRYIQGRVDSIYGGCYGYYDYGDPVFKDYTYSRGETLSTGQSPGAPRDGSGFSHPHIDDNSFVHFQPLDNSDNAVTVIFGGSEGAPDHPNLNNTMQQESYVLVDDTETTVAERYAGMDIFGGGAFAGVGLYGEETLGAGRTMVDLFAGTFNNIYGGSDQEGLIGYTHVNVPKVSKANVNAIFGGGRGYGDAAVAAEPALAARFCDNYVTCINFMGKDAIVRDALYGGNQNRRIAYDTYINVGAPVLQGTGYEATVYGGGYGKETFSGRTNVFMNDSAVAYKVFGGGRDGNAFNFHSLRKWLWDVSLGTDSEKNAAVTAYGNILRNFGTYLETNLIHLPDNTGTYVNPSTGRYDGTYTNDIMPTLAKPIPDYHQTNVHLMQGSNVTGYAYGGGFGEDAVTSGTTYIELKGGIVDKDIYGGGQGGPVMDEYGLSRKPTTDPMYLPFTAATNVYIEGGMARNVYGGGYLGHVGKHDIEHNSDISTSFADDIPAVANVTIGKVDGTSFLNGIPAITRNAYGGGEGGSVFGTANITLNNGYIGYRYKNMGTETAPVYQYVEELDDQKPNAIEMAGNLFGGGYVVNSYVDNASVTMYGGTIRGSIYGGGELGAIGAGTTKKGEFNDKGIVSGNVRIFRAGKTHVKMFDGLVKRNVYGGGRGQDSWGGDGTKYMDEDVVDNLKAKGLFCKGYVFGQTEVNIHGGEIGTAEGLAKGYGNVFGGGDIGFVYSAYITGIHYTAAEAKDFNASLSGALTTAALSAENVAAYNAAIAAGKISGTDKSEGDELTEDEAAAYNATLGGAVSTSDIKTPNALCVGKKEGVRYDNKDNSEGYYYKYENGAYVSDGTEHILTEDCKVLIEPWCKVTASGGVDVYTPNESGTPVSKHYGKNEYVPTAALNTLANKSDDDDHVKWEALSTGPSKAEQDQDGILIHNAVFAGGNTSPGSTEVYAATTTVFGNATASIHDAYHRDLITVGTGRTGGLYGDGNLTLVDGYRELNITNYGTDYHSIKSEITYEQYQELPDREAAYYEIRYRCMTTCQDKDGKTYLPGSTISADELLAVFDNYEVEKRTQSYKDGKPEVDANGYPVTTVDRDENDNPLKVLMLDPTTGEPNPLYWAQNGVCSRYAGRLMNTVQRADFCGVFGSRMVMMGAKDRVPATVDYTNYTINRVREVSLNKKVSIRSADTETDPDDGSYLTPAKAEHGNYFGIYSVVNFLGALTSDVDFNNAIRLTDNDDAETYKCVADGKAYKTATYYDWKKAFRDERKRNNGNSHNKVALASGVYLELTTEKGTGNGLYEKDWGIITGVIELDLISVQPGLGGGFVYAKNIHGVRENTGKHQTLLTNLNVNSGLSDRAVTNKSFKYYETSTSAGTTQEEWQTSGNFVHSSQTIIDDCYNIGGRYEGVVKKDGSGAMPAHYWYIKGSVYIYDQYISAYTGVSNAYSETVNIPLTITSAARGRLTLLDVKENRFAYYTDYTQKNKLSDNRKIVLRDVEYNLNDPITYWDYFMLSADEKKMFVDNTYVTVDSCRIDTVNYPSGYVMLPDEYTALYNKAESKDITPNDNIDNPVKVVIKTTKDNNGNVAIERDEHGEPVYVPFTEVFHESNNVSHDEGYILTYKVDNPKKWDTWYTDVHSATHKKDQIDDEDDDEDGPTYSPIASGLYGQQEYKVGNIISQEVYTSYADACSSMSTEHLSIPDNQGKFERAYIVTADVLEATNYAGDEQRFYKYSTLGKSAYVNTKNSEDESLWDDDKDRWSAISGSVEPAYVVTSTIQLNATDYIYRDTKMTADDKSKYVSDVNAEIKKILTTKTLAEIAAINKISDLTTSEQDALTDLQKNDLSSLLQIREDINKFIQPAYYCNSAGLYGGDYFDKNKNYRGLFAWSSMSEADRYTADGDEKFLFNYDALDLLIDPTYSRAQGFKYQYDSRDETLEGANANPAHYSLKTSIDYTATYKGTTPLTYKADDENGGAGAETNTNVRAVLTNTEYERLLNERYHYIPINVTETTMTEGGNTKPYPYYVVTTPMFVGDTPYSVGEVIDKATYSGFGDASRLNITTLYFESEGVFYFCPEGYKVDPAGTNVTSETGVTVNKYVLNSENQYEVVDATVTGTYGNGEGCISNEVPAGLVITADTYKKSLKNDQANFVIHGLAPTETSTLYVTADSDIDDLSTDKIITVVYQYDYVETDMGGMNITPVTEYHVLNIHLQFRSGVPTIEDIQKPDIILPGTTVSIKEPFVTPGAYEVTGGGWELFDDETDAESHTNGIEYTPNTNPLYLYQNKYMVAYYAKTYLGKTYSNAVPVSVANYHDLKKVMDATTHHYYIDHKDLFKDKDHIIEPKIYINDYSGEQDGLDLFKNLYDLSLVRETGNGYTVADGVITKTEGEANTALKDHKTLRSDVNEGKNLEFFLRTDIDHTGKTWEPIGKDDNESTTDVDESECFMGNLHGDGHTIIGLQNSLFKNLCGDVYNLGVEGSFTGAGVADLDTKKKGYVESCWVKTSEAPETGVKAVFGKPTDTGREQTVNCYYHVDNAFADGDAKPMPDRAFYNGELAYNLNNFYLYKRYCDNVGDSEIGANPVRYNYWLPGNDKLELKDGRYAQHEDHCSSGYNNIKYVEDRFADGDFRYAAGTIPTSVDERYYMDTADDNKEYFFPIWPDDYIFFGQMLTYGYGTKEHQDLPTAVARMDGRLSQTADANRVYRAPAYFSSKEMGVAHFNPNAYLAQKSSDGTKEAYPRMTAIDFAGHRDVHDDNGVAKPYGLGQTGSWFYPPLLDNDEGLLGIRNCDETKNLLVYAPKSDANTKTYDVLTAYFKDPNFMAYYNENDPYRCVGEYSMAVNGHLVQNETHLLATTDHLLVDKQDFNCPISYHFTSGKRMWYQRRPDTYVDKTTGWEGVSLPFTAELVTTHQKGEITHFYETDDPLQNSNNGTKIGHEYWLRELKGIKLKTGKTDVAVANFNYPDANAADGTKEVKNTYLWDHYYSDSNRKDAHTDIYQKYYKDSRSLVGYPLLSVAKPYLIGFPGLTYYEFDLSGAFVPQHTYSYIPDIERQTITFASKTGITVNVSDDELKGVEKTLDDDSRTREFTFTFEPNYLTKTLTTADSYVLNNDGDEYAQVGTEATVLPFRPYFKAVSATRVNAAPEYKGFVRSIVFSNEPSQMYEEEEDDDISSIGKLIIKAEAGKIVVTSTLHQPTTVTVVNIGGVIIDRYTIQPDETVETPVHASGVYLVNRKKLSVKIRD